MARIESYREIGVVIQGVFLALMTYILFQIMKKYYSRCKLDKIYYFIMILFEIVFFLKFLVNLSI